jgi:hypothetical protein
MNKKSQIWLGMLVVFILIIGSVGGYLYFKHKNTPLGATTTCSQLYYPQYASVCCEVTGDSDWVSATTLSSPNSATYFSCPDSTTQCRTRNPQLTCPGWSILNPLGYSQIWSLKITQPNGINYDFYKSLFSSNEIPSTSAQEFQKGGTLTYQAACISNNIYINPVMGIIEIFQKAQSPTTNLLDIEYLNTQLVRYPAGEGQHDIPNTPLCNQGASTTNYKNNEPKTISQTIVEGAATIAESLGLDSKSSDMSLTYLSSAPNQLHVGQCYRTIDKWATLPAYGNINPKGTYNGVNVMCEPSKGLIKVESVSTVGSTNYCAPTQRLTTPQDFCCSDADCKYLGMDYNCEQNTYQCKQIAGSCSSDLDCQPEGGIRYDANCYQISGKFYKWDSSCINSRCTTASKTEVKCCASYCNTYGKVCDQTIGCLDIIPPAQPCPPGQCCISGNKYNFNPASCTNGLLCCGMDNGVGTCKAQCVNGCSKDSDCKEGESCTDGSCIPNAGDKTACEAKGWNWVEQESCNMWCKIGITQPTVKSYCEKPTDYTMYLIIGGAILIIITLITTLPKMNRGNPPRSYSPQRRYSQPRRASPRRYSSKPKRRYYYK